MKIRKHFINHFEEQEDIILSEAFKNTRNVTWGLTPTTPMHFGYDPVINLLKSLHQRGYAVNITLADLLTHFSKDIDLESIGGRKSYFEHFFRSFCNFKNFRLTTSTEMMNMEDYLKCLVIFSGTESISTVRESLPKEVTAINRLGLYLFPFMQCLDALFTESNVILGYRNQEKVYNLLESTDLMKVFFKFRAPYADCIDIIYLKQPNDIKGGNLNKSSSKTRISIHESNYSLKEKISSVFAPPGIVKDNVLLSIFRNSVYPWQYCRMVLPPEIHKYEDLEIRYGQGDIHPNELKKLLHLVLSYRIHEADNCIDSISKRWINIEKLRHFNHEFNT
ncbi:hypothetical protein JMN32_18895 [Fulvivirga sp. 29W222]|uniref:tyrosine--tRNA ligase n=1 Tax=Fulvivirga marina TaxID=2494733 RepID=A0A937FYB1_9BACT|nr:hypothetical protein [Fulvivirga marina]MBL6448389.1 hypothetical protein [Fulvivirga marina]